VTPAPTSTSRCAAACRSPTTPSMPANADSCSCQHLPVASRRRDRRGTVAARWHLPRRPRRRDLANPRDLLGDDGCLQGRRAPGATTSPDPVMPSGVSGRGPAADVTPSVGEGQGECAGANSWRASRARVPGPQPAGNFVTFTSCCTKIEVFVVNVNGRHPRQLTFGANSAQSLTPVWSPDGQDILFQREFFQGHTPTGGALYTIRRNGTDLFRVTRLPAFVFAHGGAFSYSWGTARP
jgi:hypothetical protein